MVFSKPQFFYIPQRASTFPLGKQMVPAQQECRRKWVKMEEERWKLTLVQNAGSAFTLEMVALDLLSQCWSNLVPWAGGKCCCGQSWDTQVRPDLYLVFEEHVLRSVVTLMCMKELVWSHTMALSIPRTKEVGQKSLFLLPLTTLFQLQEKQADFNKNEWN